MPYKDKSSGDLVFSIFDKRDAFDSITVNLLVKYIRSYRKYQAFSSRSSELARRVFNQGFSDRNSMRTFHNLASKQ